MNVFLSQLVEVPIQIWIVFALLIISGVISLIYLRKKQDSQSKHVNTKKLALGGMCVALAFVLSFFKIMSMPQGGSVTLASMFPLVLYAFVCGPSAGIVAGISYGFLQFLQDAFAAHWISIILDYPLAFACLGLAGIISVKIKPLELRFALGLLLAIMGRFFMHLFSGAIFFGAYAPEGMNPWAYSAGYNFSYLGVEFIITLILGIILIKTPIYKSLKNTFSR